MPPHPPRRRAVLTAVAAAVAVGVLAAPAPAQADPAQREYGNGPERNDVAAPFHDTARPLAAPVPHPAPGVDTDAPYPRRAELPVHPEDPADHSVKLGLTPYHDLAPALNDLMDDSDRVSAEVVGTSTRGRDLYLVTVTEPENRARADAQRRMRELIADDPERAARDRTLADRYKTPVLVNANIHGNEWEGTDASLRVIEELAHSAEPETEELLEGARLYFVLTANPDGRVAGTRANAAGFDLNRDFVTVSQPETAAVRQVMIDTQPAVMVDQHGYVNGTLIEPCTPPHGQNYEYDLFIKNTYANALAMEEAVLELGYTPEDDGVLPPQIPFRDSADGWDDWPPIFTPMYAPYQGAVASATVEFPMRVNNADYTNLPEEELRRRSAINTDISAATIGATVEFARENREELVADQIEVFRRGAAGEEQVVPPEGWVPGFGPEDVYTTEFPRAYVLPGQDRATARLVDFLIANDVRVGRAEEAFTVGGDAYPAGSYVVDMHQPKRGMANVLLEAGRDISEDVEAMYDISGWSHGLLWGARTDPVREAVAVPVAPVAAAAPTGRVEQPGTAGWLLEVADGSDAAALNDLLAAGAEVAWTRGGAVVAPAAAGAVAEASDRHGAVFTAADDPGDAPLEPVTVAVAGAADEVFTLDALGFELVPVSTAVLNGGFDWSSVDVLYAGSGLVYADLDADARAALDGFLADGGGLVGRGATGARLNDQAGLLEATRVAGRADANGVVAAAAGEGVLTGTGGHTFVYSPGWFTGLGEGVAVEQAYADDPLVAGHWRAGADGSGGPDAAAGRAAVVSGTANGAPVVLFGTEPLFRHHPKGLFAQVAQALYWAAAEAPPA